MTRASVDLPQPDSPTRPSVSPLRTSRLTPSTARTTSAPIPPTGKCLYTSTTRRMTGSRAGCALVPADASTAIRHLLEVRDGLQLLRRLVRDRDRLELL